MKNIYFTLTDIAKFADVSRQRVHQMIGEKKLRPTIKKDQLFLFSKKEVERFLLKYFGRKIEMQME